MIPQTTDEIATLLLMPQILTQDEYSKIKAAYKTIVQIRYDIEKRNSPSSSKTMYNKAAIKLLKQIHTDLITLMLDRQFHEYMQKEGVL